MRIPLTIMGICVAFSVVLLSVNVPNTYFLPINVSYKSLTDPVKKQVDCLTENIYFEAGHEPDVGKVAVALVTLNRVASGNYAPTICSVVHQKSNNVCQFSWVCEQANLNKALTIRDTLLYNSIREIAVRVLMNYEFIDDVTEGATYYHADYVNPGWNLPKTTKIGRHIFYKKQSDLNDLTKEIKL